MAWATLCPPALRPSLGPPDLERFIAFVGMGALGMAAFPRRRLGVLLALVAFALLLELGQALIPGRHPRIADAAIKATGALTGGLVARGLPRVRFRPMGQGPQRVPDGRT